MALRQPDLPFEVWPESWNSAREIAKFMSDKWRAAQADDEQMAMADQMADDGVDWHMGYMLIAYRAVAELATATGQEPTVVLARYAREADALSDVDLG